MSDVGDLHGDRAAIGAAAQAQCERDDHHQPDHGGAAGEEVRGVDRVADRTVDRVGDPHHHDEADEGEQVHAIRDVVPVEFTEAAALAGASQFLQRRLRVGRHRHGERI